MDQQVQLVATGDVGNFIVVDCAPQAPGPGEIRLRHDGIGVNFIDIYHRMGLYPLPLPAVLGVEGAGTVEAVGEGVSNVRVGERVAYAGIPGAMRPRGCCRRGVRSACRTASTPRWPPCLFCAA